MTEQSNQPQNPPAGNERPEVYSISQDKDGSIHFSRRNFLYFGAAIGGTLLIRRACPRYGPKSAPSDPVQVGMMPSAGIYIHAAPSIASNIADTLQQNDLVRLISDHPDLGWVEVATRTVQHGWVERSFVDFSRAIKSSSPNFGLSSTLSPTSTQTQPPLTFSVQLQGGNNEPKNVIAAGQAQFCGEVIQNGDFEGGSIYLVEESSGTIIRNDYPDPHQGSWVAWLGGLDAEERLTQLFHLDADVQDDQTLEFYLKVSTEETGTTVYDTLNLRFLDAAGETISNDIPIANNTTPTGWVYITVDLGGTAEFADQDIQIQFECYTDSSNPTSFVIDLVSLDLICGVSPPTPTETPTPIEYYVYIPVIVKAPAATPTDSPTSTPSPSATPCPSYNSCPSDCSSDYCSSDCVFHCIYDCPFDCIYYCGYDWY